MTESEGFENLKLDPITTLTQLYQEASERIWEVIKSVHAKSIEIGEAQKVVRMLQDRIANEEGIMHRLGVRSTG